MHRNQNGSHIVGILLLVAVLGVAGFAGYTVISKNKDKTTNSSQKTTTEDSEESSLPKKISVVEKGALILPNGYADPTVAKTANGYRLYANRQSGAGAGKYNSFTSVDGKTWVIEKEGVVPNAATGRAVTLPDGIRFYYPGMQPIKPSDPQADMYSSFTTDGLTFTKDAGTRLQPQSSAYYLEGPTVFQLGDKTWRMYFNENSAAAGNQRDGIIWGAKSPDGLAWTRDDKPTIESGAEEAKLNQPWKQVLHPFVLANPKGGYIMFYNAHSEVFAAVSEDGIKWDKLGQVGITGADVDGYFQADGTIRIFYGGFTEQTGGLVYTGVVKAE